MTAVEPHVYLSTSCVHGFHERCRSDAATDSEGEPFRKVPSRCKHCSAPCICECHGWTQARDVT